ncbi:hypothetical protein BHM03_00021467 [Ensete ventricosum]|nr:hypothetical protein BHM03_00021467 [Ensete ventricosum]
MTRADVKALQALEVMKSCHDFDSTEIPTEEATRRAPKEGTRRVHEVPNNCLTEGSIGQRKKGKVFGQHRPRHEVDKSKSQATKGKGPADPAIETVTPRPKPKSMRELCSTRFGVDDRDYHAIRMYNLPEHAPDAPLEIDLLSLMHGTQIWLEGEASTRYI